MSMILMNPTALVDWWAGLYAGSSVVSETVTTVHMLALFLGGGLAVAADRSTLRIAGDQLQRQAIQIDELRAVHRPVLAALVVLFATGVLMTAADLDTFVQSPAFWIKLGFVACLLANGAWLAWTERRIHRQLAVGDEGRALLGGLWRHLRRGAALSLALWLATLVAGTLLVSAA